MSNRTRCRICGCEPTSANHRGICLGETIAPSLTRREQRDREYAARRARRARTENPREVAQVRSIGEVLREVFPEWAQ